MARPDLDAMAPGDGTVALRSLPRRYREAFDGGERRAKADRAGPEGVSALDLSVDTVRSLALLERALEQIVSNDHPVLHAGIVDPAQREFPDTTRETVDDMLDDLARVANGFADRVGRVAAGDWDREATVAAGGTITALDVLREAVRTGTDNLRQVERLLA